MGLPTCKPADAGRRAQSRGADDPFAAQGRLQESHRRRYGLGLIVALAAGPAASETLRIATFAAPLSRDGPGLLLRDLGREDAQIDAILAIIAAADPEILLLTDFDYDLDTLALAVFADRAGYPHHFAYPPNSGRQTDLDLDGNGRTGEPRDAQGYGRFFGDGGMAILSRHPVGAGREDLSDVLWSDLPGAILPEGEPQEVQAVQRLSSTGHWIVPIQTDAGPVTLMAYSATPPVFDGPEDRNGLRNRDELRLWSHVLDTKGTPPHAVLLGNANLDPVDGEGYPDAMQALLDDPRFIDPKPASAGAALVADPGHRGDPALDTADWPSDGPGNLRVSYVLPTSDWQVSGAGVLWPAPDDPMAELVAAAGPHRLVWVDLTR